MKKLYLFLPLLLAACSNETGTSETTQSFAEGLWLAPDGSGLCQAEEGAALLIKAEDGSSCMAQGSVEAGEGGALAFIPRGDTECRIPIAQDGDTLTFGDGGEACSYYCGGTATLTSKSLRRSTATDSRLEDIAGDPLC